MERHCNILLLMSHSESSSMSLDANPLLITLALPPPLKLIEISLLRLTFLFNWSTSRASSRAALSTLLCLCWTCWNSDSFLAISSPAFGSTSVRQRRQIWLNFGGTLHIVTVLLGVFGYRLNNLYPLVTQSGGTRVLNSVVNWVALGKSQISSSFFNYHINPFTTMLCSLLFEAMIIKAIVRWSWGWSEREKRPEHENNWNLFFLN